MTPSEREALIRALERRDRTQALIADVPAHKRPLMSPASWFELGWDAATHDDEEGPVFSTEPRR
jgi:hypothetical protein